jgi:hypothetical protein
MILFKMPLIGIFCLIVYMHSLTALAGHFFAKIVDNNNDIKYAQIEYLETDEKLGEIHVTEDLYKGLYIEMAALSELPSQEMKIIITLKTDEKVEEVFSFSSEKEPQEGPLDRYLKIILDSHPFPHGS